MRIGLVVFLTLVQLSSSLAESLEITIHTFPPGAEMTDQFSGYLGKSGSPILVEWERSKGPLEINFQLPGHKPTTRTLTYKELKAGRYPQSGLVDLPPDSSLVAMQDFFRYRWPVAVFGVLVVGALVWWRRSIPVTGQEAKRHPKFGRYQARELIGRGGASEVYLAEHEGIGGEELVAVKVLHDLSEKARLRFEREVKVCMDYKHPNLIQLYDWGVHDDKRHFLVCEYLNGEPLDKRIETEGPLQVSATADIIEATGCALTYLHRQEVIHRDVKPANIFLCRDGRVKLLDLGIAKSTDVVPLTQTGVAVGTPHYMAPEQIRGQAEPASDQYALGVMAYEMLTGERPFDGGDITQLYKKHLEDEPPSLVVESCSPLVEQIIHRMMAKQPKNRFPELSQAVEALVEALRDEAGVGDDTQVG